MGMREGLKGGRDWKGGRGRNWWGEGRMEGHSTFSVQAHCNLTLFSVQRLTGL